MKYLYILGLAVLFSCGESDKNAVRKIQSRGLAVEALLIEEHKLDESIHIIGTVLPNEQVELKAEENGRLMKILFEEGSKVAKGSLLFQLDDRYYQVQAKNIQLQLQLALKELKRNEALVLSEAISEEIFDISANKVATLQAESDLLAVRIDHCQIRAPFAGRVGLRQVSVGAYISIGQELVSLVQERPLKIEFEVPELYASQIKKNMPLIATASETHDTLHALIYAFEPKIDPGSRSLKVRAISKNLNEHFVPGVFLNIILQLDESSSAILIPTEALIPELNGQKVFKIIAGKIKSQAVITGIRRASDIQIIDGLLPGDSIMLTGILQARDGMAVQISNEIKQE